MYTLALSPEQLQIRASLREFVAAEIRPAALAPARLEPLEEQPLTELIEKAARIGLRSLALPEESGGAGADTLTCCIAAEELAAGDAGLALVLVETATIAEFLFQHALPQQQRERLLDQFLADETFHLALAADERHDVLGIDYHRPGADADEPEITARLCADAWALNGHKRRVANA